MPAASSIADVPGLGQGSGVDLNGPATPLLEIVSEPDIRSADERWRTEKASPDRGLNLGNNRGQHGGGELPLRRQTCRFMPVGSDRVRHPHRRPRTFNSSRFA